MNTLFKFHPFPIVYNALVTSMNYDIRLYCIRTIKPMRCRSRKREGDVILEERIVEQSKYKSGKGKMTVRNGMEMALRNVGLTQRQFVEHDPLNESDIIDAFDDAIIHGEEFYDVHTKEVQARKNFIKKKQTIRKYFHEPPETNLLTVAAKEQIKYLYRLDPVKWDAEKLSQSFPISLDGVKKLLRSRFTPQSAERQQKHDKSVAVNIKLLKEGSQEGISPITMNLWQEGKLKLEHCTGNASLPVPNEECKSLQLQPEQNPAKVGQFLSIVKPYLDLKQREELRNMPQPVADKTQQCGGTNEKLWQVTVNSTPKYKSDNDSDDPLCATYLTRRVNTPGPDITLENLQRSTTNDSKVESNHKLENKYSHETASVNLPNFNNERIKKYENDAIELIVESKNETSNAEAYVYDTNFGYQYPLGKSPDYSNKITIPQHLYKEGCKYKIGNCYYDEDGNFLYRTFA